MVTHNFSKKVVTPRNVNAILSNIANLLLEHNESEDKEIQCPSLP